MPPPHTEQREITVKFTHIKGEPMMALAVTRFPIPTMARRVKGCRLGDITARFDLTPRLIFQVHGDHIAQIGQIFGAPTARFCNTLYSTYMQLKPPRLRSDDLSGEMIDQDGELEFKFRLDPDFIPGLVTLLTQQSRENPIM